MAYRFSPAVARLVQALAKLPGIGQKTAQRLAFHILDESREDALALARASDLIACVPERHTVGLRAGMHSFPLPVSPPEITVSLLWHPRLDADPAHRWLRGLVRDACAGERRRGRA